jgi:hypothetical protein
MTQYTSPHDEPWFSDPDQPWGGTKRKRYVDPDEAYDRMLDQEIEDAPEEEA